MAIVFLWILVAVVVGLLAAKRGRGSGNWFVISCALSPIVGLVLLFGMADLSVAAETDATHVKCPSCAEKVLREAVKCKHCSSVLTPSPRQETLMDKLTKPR